MRQYIDLLQDVLHNGIDTDDRTGVGTKSVFGRMLRLNLQDGFPIITTRKVSLRIAFEETMFFLRGMSDTKELERNSGIQTKVLEHFLALVRSVLTIGSKTLFELINLL